MKRYNKTLKNKLNKRDRIIYGENYKEEKYHAGLRRFSDLTTAGLEALVKQKLICTMIGFDHSPLMMEFYKFLRRYKDEPAISITFSGYTYDSKRLEISDMEMTILDAVEVTVNSHNLQSIHPARVIADFCQTFGFCQRFNYVTDDFNVTNKNGIYTLYAAYERKE